MGYHLWLRRVAWGFGNPFDLSPHWLPIGGPDDAVAQLQRLCVVAKVGKVPPAPVIVQLGQGSWVL